MRGDESWFGLLCWFAVLVCCEIAEMCDGGRNVTQTAATKKLSLSQLYMLDKSAAKVDVRCSCTPRLPPKINRVRCIFVTAAGFDVNALDDRFC